MDLSFLTNDDPLSSLEGGALRILGARREQTSDVVTRVFVLHAQICNVACVLHLAVFVWAIYVATRGINGRILLYF